MPAHNNSAAAHQAATATPQAVGPVEAKDSDVTATEEETTKVYTTPGTTFHPRLNRPDQVLQLQRTIGNQAVCRLINQTRQQQQKVSRQIMRAAQETNTAYQKYDQFFAPNLTLAALDSYAKSQVDWHASPDLDDSQRDEIRSVLAFVRGERMLAACGEMEAATVRDAIKDADNVKYLKKYAIVETTKKPFDLSMIKIVQEAVDAGKAIEKLQAAISDPALAKGMDDMPFKFLVKHNVVDDFIAYATTSNPTPTFQASNGQDVLSYLRLKLEDGKEPLDYNAGELKDRVRNYHRFTGTALDGLVKNYADASKAKPLTLILHTALDNDAAFHRDPKLDAVITNDKIHTLMVEGKETLAEMQAEIEPLATKYGKSGRVDQVMIAGHGEARRMELTGSVKEQGGQMQEVHNNIDLDNNKAETEALFDEILKYMNDKDDELVDVLNAVVNKPELQPHRRVIFNACLTNSNRVGKNIVSMNIDDAKKEVRDYIKANASLATSLQEKATKDKKSITSIGANASIKQVDMVDASGALDLYASYDPKITASKLEYMEEGDEPVGVIRAALETWGEAQTNEARTKFKEAMQRRANKAAATWNEAIVKSIYELILINDVDTPNNYLFFDQLAEGIFHAQMEPYCRVNFLWGYIQRLYNNSLVDTFMPNLTATTEWGKYNHLPLVFYQIMLRRDGAKATDFLSVLGDKFTCSKAYKYISFDCLNPVLKDLLAIGVSAGATKLALLGVMGDVVNDDCKDYLVNQVGINNKFPVGLKITEYLDGMETEDGILQRIGLMNVPNAPALANPDANVKLKGDAKNKEYIRPLTQQGKVIADTTRVFPKPDATAPEDKTLNKNDKVHITGQTEDKAFWAIEHVFTDKTRGTGFIKTGEMEAASYA